jgi:hypothetical protein
MNAAPVDDARFLDLLTRVSQAIGAIGGGEQLVKRHDLEVWAFFDRCRSLLDAIRLLIANGFPHEAVMLVRPLFTDSLALTELAAVDIRRGTELVVGWELYSLAELRGILLEYGAQGLDVADFLADTDTRRAEVEKYGRDRGVDP